jgi:2-oxoisovalerate dehydrogenase E1 component beta subunit
MPSNPLDAYGLMLSAIQDPNPVMFLKPKALLRIKGEELIPGEPETERDLKNRIDAPIGDRTDWVPNWPEVKEYFVPIGKGKITRTGEQLTIVTSGRHVLMCNQVADELSVKGYSVEVLDLRSIYPYDWSLIKSSIEKTGRVLFVNEDTEVTNFAEHLSYRVCQELFYQLLARPRVVAGKNLPGIGLAAPLEEVSVPQVSEIKQAAIEIMEEVP